MTVCSLSLAIGGTTPMFFPSGGEVIVAENHPDLRAARTTSLSLNYLNRATTIQRPLPVPGAGLKTPDDAVKAALANLKQTVSPYNYCYTRYLWHQDGGYLLRIDGRQYAPQGADLDEWMRFWEELSFDWMFSKLITKDTVEKNIGLRQALRRTVKRRVAVPGPIRKETIIVDHPGGEYIYPDDSGRRHANLPAGRYECELEFHGTPTYRDVTEEVELILGKDIDVLRFNAPHIDEKAFTELQELTHSLAPVVEHHYLKTRALRTIKRAPNGVKGDNNLYETLFGGLYYEFRGIKLAKDVLGADTKATDQDLFLEQRGVGNIKGRLAGEAQFDQLRSDQRALIIRSGISGMPRIGEELQTLAAKDAFSKGWITDDVFAEDVDIGKRAFANLRKPTIRAREGIFPNRLGLHDYVLFNGDGARQDEVPINVAEDTEIPSPYRKRLEPAIGCLRCHQRDGSDGWKPFPNQALQMLANNRLDIFGDRSQRDAFSTDNNDRLAGLYTGDFTDNLRIGRNALARATLKATGPWTEGGRGDQADVVKLAAAYLSSEFEDELYTLVDAKKALRKMGLEVPQDKALELFRRLVPPDLSPEYRLADVGTLEDSTTSLILDGLAVDRTDFALVYSRIMERAQQSLKKGVKLP